MMVNGPDEIATQETAAAERRSEKGTDDGAVELELVVAVEAELEPVNLMDPEALKGQNSDMSRGERPVGW